MYPMLERISPRTRKLELFARMHNTHAGYAFLSHICASYHIFRYFTAFLFITNLVVFMIINEMEMLEDFL